MREAVLKTLKLFQPDFEPDVIETYLLANEPGYRKFITGVIDCNGQRAVVKLVHEDDDLTAEREKIERQSAFSEQLRATGILTPRRYTSNGQYCVFADTSDGPLCAFVEDYCGREITQISESLAARIGSLLGQVHSVSEEKGIRIGCGTLFGAAVENDVNAFDKLCKICEDERIDSDTVSRIRSLYLEKMSALRDVWDTLPCAATQGDISINNLVDTGEDLILFDYNNAGDEVLVSDMVLEGLLTAYEMNLPEDAPQEVPQRLFLSFWEGYRSVRSLTQEERKTAWDIYVLYDSLWFTKIVYKPDSLEQLLKNGDVSRANIRLRKMLADLERQNDGRFER